MKLSILSILIHMCICNYVRCEIEKDVIIIGGGAAGIAAATRLNANGVDFVLLEAEPRLGGRIKSVPFGEAKVDLGAEWINGEKGNIVFEIMKNSGLIYHSNDSYNIYLSNRQDLGEEFSLELLGIFNQIYMGLKNDSNPEETLGDYCIRHYMKRIKETYGNDERKMKIAMEVLPMLEKNALAWESAFSWQHSSALSNMSVCEGDLQIHWNGKGYFSMLEYLMKETDISGRLITNRVIKKIELKQNSVVVKGEDFTYKGKYVIFTPSLGVLKNHHSDIFDPPLSELKAKAIDALGYGSIHKVWLHFPERWWPAEKFPGVSMAWTCDDLYTIKTQFPKGPNKDGRSFLSNLYGVYGTPQNPRVVTAWFSGEFSREIENVEDDLLIEGIMFALEKFIGHLYQIQKPDKIIREKWYSNEHFHGTYSYQTLESRRLQPDGVKILAEPVRTNDNRERLMFAGEATNLVHYASVHGALESGYREADRVIKALKRNKL